MEDYVKVIKVKSVDTKPGKINQNFEIILEDGKKLLCLYPIKLIIDYGEVPQLHLKVPIFGEIDVTMPEKYVTYEQIKQGKGE